MALAEVDLKPRYSRGKKPVRLNKVQSKAQDVDVASKSQWVEDTPSFLDGIRATLATLTEEEKEWSEPLA